MQLYPRATGFEGNFLRKTVSSSQRDEHALLGAILRAKRLELGMTQRDLATSLERSHSFVWKVETGRQHLDIPTLMDIARLYKTTASALLLELETSS